MAGINKVILVGNLGKDPEVRYTGNQVPVATFSLATTETYKDNNGERRDQTEWHNIVAWRQLAEVAEKFLRKGKQIYVEGKLRTRSYDDKDGNKRYTTEVVADVIQMLGRREGDEGGDYGDSNESRQQTRSYNSGNSAGNAGSSSRPEPAQTGPNVQVDDDDLPF
jgi:single-strand DNA-binding protein